MEGCSSQPLQFTVHREITGNIVIRRESNQNGRGISPPPAIRAWPSAYWSALACGSVLG